MAVGAVMRLQAVSSGQLSGPSVHSWPAPIGVASARACMCAAFSDGAGARIFDKFQEIDTPEAAPFYSRNINRSVTFIVLAEF